MTALAWTVLTIAGGWLILDGRQRAIAADRQVELLQRAITDLGAGNQGRAGLTAYSDQLALRLADAGGAPSEPPDLYALGAELRDRVQESGMVMRRFETSGSPQEGLLELLAHGDQLRLAGFLHDLSRRQPPVPTRYVAIQRIDERMFSVVMRVHGEPLPVAGP